MSKAEEGEITKLLSKVAEGDRDAESRVLTLLYNDLRRLARHYLHKERPDHTLEPTALVHEAYMRISKTENVQWRDRAHFMAVASRAMRHVLVDHARGVQAVKRGGQKIQLDTSLTCSEALSVEVLALDEALLRLATWDARQARVVEMRFFGGLQLEEIAELLQVSERTVKRDWNMARAWLFGELRPSRKNKSGCSDQ